MIVAAKMAVLVATFMSGGIPQTIDLGRHTAEACTEWATLARQARGARDIEYRCIPDGPFDIAVPPTRTR